jgi:hypothetical protein
LAHHNLEEENSMTKLKLFAAVALLSTLVAAPAMAQTYQRDYDNGYRDRGPVGAAAGVAGAAVGTAAAIATSPFRDSYGYDNERDYGPNGFACHRGAWFKGADGRRHMCQ